MGTRIRLAGVVLGLTVGWGLSPAFAAEPAGMRLEPTATCPEETLAELTQTIGFVRGQTWTDRPGDHPLNIVPDLDACRVVLHIGELTDEEEAALQAGAGSRLAIEYRQDWAEPSRLLLILWIVFGGSGLIWIYRRYART